MDEEHAFCRELVEGTSDLSAIMDEHLADYGELLPYVFFGDVTRYALGNGNQRRELVKYLDAAMERKGDAIKDLIAVSFIENIETAEQLRNVLEGESAPNLESEWHRQHESC